MKFLNKSELAQEMGVSFTTIGNWVRRGCPSAQLGDEKTEWQFDLEAVRVWYLNYHNSKSPNGQNPCNLFREIQRIMLNEFFTSQGLWIENTITFLAEKNNLSIGAIEKIFFDMYMFEFAHFREWLERDRINSIFTEAAGRDIDDVWSAIFPGAKTLPNKTICVDFPKTISKFYNKKGNLKKQ